MENRLSVFGITYTHVHVLAQRHVRTPYLGCAVTAKSLFVTMHVVSS